MRSLNKNRQKLWYSTYNDQITIYEKDEYGNIKYIEIDGEMVPVELAVRAGYNNPVSFYANISAAKGNSDSKVFGISLDYTKTIATTDLTLPITETSLLWYETAPVIKDDGTIDDSTADYSIVAVARSLNSVVYAIKKLPKKG